MLGQSAGPPPLQGVINLLEVGWDWNPTAQCRGHNQTNRGGRKAPLQQSGPGSHLTPRQRKGRSRHGHVLTTQGCYFWPEQRGTTKPWLSFPNHNGEPAAKMTPQISASISAAAIKELLFLATRWTVSISAPHQLQPGHPPSSGSV